jgi:hypothetical protein
MKVNVVATKVIDVCWLAALVCLGTSLLLPAEAVDAASASDLLEKAIYSQETRGDLDSAIGLYQEVIAKARDSQALAAQAQYRLGVCYYRKRDFARASAIFDRLKSDYPDQKELIALAQEYLSREVDLQPSPWLDGELLRLDVRLAGGLRIGPAVYSVVSGELNGRKTWKLTSRIYAGAQQLSRVEVEADSFKPLRSRWKHSFVGEAEATYSPGKVELKTKGKKEPKLIELGSVIYDNEEVVQLMRRLPLATNYSTTIKIFPTLAGGATIPLKIDVAGIDNLEVPAGNFECYRCELSVKQTFWFSTDPHRYLVKFEAGGAICELASIGQLTPDQPVAYRVAGVMSLSAPDGWIFDNADPDDENARKTIILDPESTATSWMIAKSRDDLKPAQRTSLRAYADSAVKEAYKSLKDMKVREDSWKEITVAGYPAISVVADFAEMKQKNTAYAVFSFVGTNAVEILTYAPTPEFETFKPNFQAVIDSARATQ